MFPRCCLILVLALLTPRVVVADDPKLTEEQRQLFDQATGILTHSCLKCHAGSSAKSKLDLTTREGIMAGGEQGGPAFDSDNPTDSSLLLAIRYDSFEMPPNGQMSPRKIAVLDEWVRQGLPWPDDHQQLEAETQPGPPAVNDQTKRFWSFQPVREPEVPDVPWGQNPIDAFIASRLKQHSLTPSPAAPAASLIRRMYYDLTGLPPDPKVVSGWSARLQSTQGDINQEVLHELIDELLESPHYGEQWARHWLDLVRYAETNSYERDGAKPFVWRYRDYVIRSFNSDKPYDQFLTEQLAGDELETVTADSVIATGYYRLGRWDDEPADPLLAFYDDIDDIITTTSQTMLGLTVNCARCHDHKIDPIPQRDYYRMVGFFRHVRRYGVRSDKTVADASVREVNLAEDETLLGQEIRKHRDELEQVEQLITQFDETVMPLLSAPQKEDYQFAENRLPVVIKLKDNGLTKAQVDQYRNLTRRQRRLSGNPPSGRAKALCITEDIGTIYPTNVLLRGSPHAPGLEVLPGFPSVLSPPEVTMPETSAGATTSGRRTVLADWITSPENPLTARVMVNRIWQYHFGRGIVRTSSDFGFQGTPPTHPQLLDWLATQFVKNGWSVKQMHRLIMSSNTYQMSSSSYPKALDTDPVNDLFWRFDMRRLSAEEIRDSILQATGSLNSATMYGPSIYTDIPDEVKAGQSRPGQGWGKSTPEDRNRRSIYIHVKRSLLDPLLESFDFADTDQSCPVRFATTQPTQALGLLNSEFMRQQAATFAELLKQESTVAEQVRLGLLRTIQRPPTDDEIQTGIALMEQLQSKEGLTLDQARHYFCLVTLNLNEFMYLD